MTVDLTVPAGARLWLWPGEFTPNPKNRDEILTVVSLAGMPFNGTVLARGHLCPGRCPYPHAGWCWEGQVSVTAIKANLDGRR